MTQDYDLVVIGGGHNGLVAAATLAKAGRSVLVLEHRSALGGVAGSEQVYPGFIFNLGAPDAGLFRPEIVAALDLHKYGLEFIESPVAAFAPLSDGQSLTLYRDPEKTIAEVARFSKDDADNYPTFLELTQKLSGVLSEVMLLAPPKLRGNRLRDLWPWAKAALDVKRLGNKAMIELMRTLPMTAKEFLDEWFETEALKGLLAAPGLIGSMQGPQASGTAFMMLYQMTGAPNGGFKSSRFVRGGVGKLSESLASAARAHGAEIRLGMSVKEIMLGEGVARGVLLEDGAQISSRMVVSNADPQRTLFDLVGVQELEPRVMRRVRNIRFRGCTTKLNLALSGLPQFTAAPDESHLTGHVLITPSLDYLERAYDDAKHGRISTHPILDITVPSLMDASLAPAGQHIMSITMQFAPYHLAEGPWETARTILENRVLDILSQYAPNIRNLILHSQLITPLDWERDYGLTEGSIFHGQMGLDQILFMRPIPGYAQYCSPIQNLYLCGAGTHPGGGLTGAPGFNAARQILKDW